MVGKVVSHYKILDKLGESGGSARVTRDRRMSAAKAFERFLKTARCQIPTFGITFDNPQPDDGIGCFFSWLLWVSARSGGAFMIVQRSLRESSETATEARVSRVAG